ncbi:MAG: hypothetical protein II659_05250 [Bacteroidales bacterium]|nr:hypothetical protein [Bacteroidales bacterium]
MDEKLTIWETEGPKERVRRNVKCRKLDLKKFVRQNTEIIIRSMALLCAVLVFASGMAVRLLTEKRLREEFAETLAAERFRVEQDTIARVKEQYGINAQNAEKTLIEEQAKIVTKVLYPMRNNREVGLHLACWAVFNRVDHLRYSDDLLSVCSADQAFMGWSENNPVLEDLYNIALEEVTRWHSGVRPMDTGYVYLYWTPNEIYLFDDYGHKLFESDWSKYIDSLS